MSNSNHTRWWRRTWHRRTVRRLLIAVGAGGVLAGSAITGAWDAEAAPDRWVREYGRLICQVLNSHPDFRGVEAVSVGVTEDGTPWRVVVEEAVRQQCPQHTGLLQAHNTSAAWTGVWA